VGSRDATRPRMAELDGITEAKAGGERVHPACDVVDDTLYVAVQAGTRRNHEGEWKPVHLLLGSTVNEDGTLTREVWTQQGEGGEEGDDWLDALADRGIAPWVTTLNLRDCGPRWSVDGISAWAQAETDPPAWGKVWTAVRKALTDYLVLIEDEYFDVLTAWVLASYLYQLFPTVAVLHLLGDAESGKGRIGEALARLAFNAINQGMSTRAALVRSVNQGLYSVIIAEADDIAQQKSGDDFAKALQAGFTKQEAVYNIAVQNPKTQEWEARGYYVYSPRVLCSTVDFARNAPLRTRCIRLSIVATDQPGQQGILDKEMGHQPDRWARLRDRLYRLQLDRWPEVRDAIPKVQAAWSGKAAPRSRTRDKWLPLATVAYLAGPEPFRVITALATEAQARRGEARENTLEAVLYHFMHWLVEEGDVAATRDELYDHFTDLDRRQRGKAPDDQLTPQWCQEEGLDITRRQLREMARGPNLFLHQLQDKHLLPAHPVETKRHNEYRIRQRDVLTRLPEYIRGDQPVASVVPPDDPPETVDRDAPWRAEPCERCGASPTGLLDDRLAVTARVCAACADELADVLERTGETRPWKGDYALAPDVRERLPHEVRRVTTQFLARRPVAVAA
jgi:hypothetical protein